MNSSADVTRRLAVGAVLLCAILNSFGGALLRSLDGANSWQVVTYRSGAVGLGMLILLCARERSRVGAVMRHGIGWSLLGGAFIAMANALFILSLNYTGVANTLFILSGVPFFTAVLARLVLKERLQRVTLAAMCVAFLGMAIIVKDGLAHGTLLGNLLALGCGLAFSCYVVVLRLRREADMFPTLVIGGLLAAGCAAVMAGFELAVSVFDLTVCLLWGGVLSVATQLLFWFGARHVAGAELTLLVMIEFILGPTWVWLLFGERASTTTLVGGALVLLAVAARAVAGARPTRLTLAPRR